MQFILRDLIVNALLHIIDEIKERGKRDFEQQREAKQVIESNFALNCIASFLGLDKVEGAGNVAERVW